MIYLPKHNFILLLDCKYVFQNSGRGNISNHGYPKRIDGRQQDCEWLIQIPTGSYVQLTVIDLDLPPATLRGQCHMTKVMLGGFNKYGHRLILGEVSNESSSKMC